MTTTAVNASPPPTPFCCSYQLLHHMLSRGPPELRSPPQVAGMSPGLYAEWMFSAAASTSAKRSEDTGNESTAHSSEVDAERLAPSAAGLLRAEEAAWARVRECLDEYAQRMNVDVAAVVDGEEDEASPHYVYTLLWRRGPQLLATLGRQLSGSE